jgi:hypothetical protein
MSLVGRTMHMVKGIRFQLSTERVYKISAILVSSTNYLKVQQSIFENFNLFDA